MDDNKVKTAEVNQQEGTKTIFDVRAIYTSLILNWTWFVASALICLACAYLYLRYTTPVYQAYAKLLIKEEQSGRRQSVVRDLKLYVTYTTEGKFKEVLLYKNEPIKIDLDPVNLEKINSPFDMQLTYSDGKYHLTGTYSVPIDDTHSKGPYTLNKTFNRFPTIIYTKAGIMTITENLAPDAVKMTPDVKIHIVLTSPNIAAYQYQQALTVSQTAKSTTIAQLTLRDVNQQRAIDYLKQLSI